MGWSSDHAFTEAPADWIGIFQVKEAREPLNLSALSAIASPWFFRWHGLTAKHAVGPTTEGYGAPKEIRERDAQSIVGEPVHVIPRQARYTRDEALRIVRDALGAITRGREGVPA
jgi:hypothetical protein